jgi:defect-in-organelle-trafficking protein DotC
MDLLNNITKIFIGAAIFCCALNAAAATPLVANVGYITTPHLAPGNDQVNPIRYAAIRQAATSLGARGGLAWQARNIDLTLTAESVFLDQVFDFNQLLLGHNVLPPVLAQSDNDLNLDDNDTLRIATKSYRILRPARFVTAPPNWRDYLWMRFPRPKLSNQSLLPHSRAEAQIWNYYVKKGWKNGSLQADHILTDNLNRLKQDMIGMILYRKLLALHMVSAPFVASANLGVTGDANQLRINDQVLRITAQSQLQTNAKKWKPVITP